MRFEALRTVGVFAYIFLPLFVTVSSVSPDNRVQKHFSLFSVVQFLNDECTTDGSVAGGVTQGTCFTSTECTDIGGISAGRCASGFGVCCASINSGGVTATISQNRTRLRNAAFPMIATAVTQQTVTYTVNKMQSDICQLRLDFTRFVIAGPNGILENIGAAGTQSNCQDTLIITTTDVAAATSTNTGVLCGSLTGEHLYIELSPTAGDQATITLNTVADTANQLTAVLAQRVWDIKVSQIECHAAWRAPAGCHRYFTQDTGKIMSLNFRREQGGTVAAMRQNTGIELPMQRINTCIRRSKSMCCVEYQVCTADDQGTVLADTADGTSTANMGLRGTWNAGWSIDLNTSPHIIDASQVGQGLVDSQCTGDYVEIPSSWSAACGAGTSSGRTTINTRYCGGRFGANLQGSPATTASTPVCDCSEPFVVKYQTDDLNDLNLVNTNNAGAVVQPRGFCLDFRQVPCWQ